MIILSHLDIDGLDLRDGVNFNFVPLGLFAGEKEIITNPLMTDGESYSSSRRESRPIVLNGQILGDTITNMNILKAKLFRPGLKKITCSIAGMPSFYIYAELKNWACDEVNPEFMSCQLLAPKPDLISTAAEALTLGAISNVSLTFPLTFPITFGALTGGSGILTNQGTAEAYPVFTIIGSCDTIAITNSTTGESISCAVTLGPSDVLIIDCTPENRGIYLNGVRSMALKNGSWITCAPGENTIVFTRNSLESTQHCSVAMESRWY